MVGRVLDLYRVVHFEDDERMAAPPRMDRNYFGRDRAVDRNWCRPGREVDYRCL